MYVLIHMIILTQHNLVWYVLFYSLRVIPTYVYYVCDKFLFIIFCEVRTLQVIHIPRKGTNPTGTYTCKIVNLILCRHALYSITTDYVCHILYVIKCATYPGYGA